METLHGKCPMDGVGGTMKRVVFDLVKSNKITINSAEEFEREALRTVLSIKFRNMMRLLSHRLCVLPLKLMAASVSIM